MPGWIVQTYLTVPAELNVRSKVPSFCVLLVKPGPTTLCFTDPLKTQVTVSPTDTSMVSGSNLLSMTSTSPSVAGDVGSSSSPPPQAATSNGNTNSATAT